MKLYLFCAGQMVGAKNDNIQQEAPNVASLQLVDPKEHNAVSGQVPADVEAPELQESKDKGWKTCFHAYVCFVACIVIIM